MGDFEKILRANQIQNFSITSKEITNAKFILGLHLAGVRWETKIFTLKMLDSDFVEIPIEFQLLHNYVTKVANVLVVNGMPFFIALSRKLHFVTFNTHTIYDC